MDSRLTGQKLFRRQKGSCADGGTGRETSSGGRGAQSSEKRAGGRPGGAMEQSSCLEGAVMDEATLAGTHHRVGVVVGRWKKKFKSSQNKQEKGKRRQGKIEQAVYSLGGFLNSGRRGLQTRLVPPDSAKSPLALFLQGPSSNKQSSFAKSSRQQKKSPPG